MDELVGYTRSTGITEIDTNFWVMSEVDKKKGWKILKEKLKDEPISAQEFADKSQELGDLQHKVLPNKAYVASKYVTPLTVEMKSELLTKAWIMTPTEPTLERHIPKHGKQHMEPDNYKITFTEYRRTPPPFNGPYASLHSNKDIVDLESNEEKDLYQYPRFGTGEPVGDHLYHPSISFWQAMIFHDPKIRQLRNQRHEDDIKQEDIIKKGYRDLYDIELKNIAQEVDDVAWCPSGLKDKPIFKNGGFFFKEWEKEMKEMIRDYNRDEIV